MHTLTATEASRSFAALLDEVEKGETVVITRGGRRIATIGPVSTSNGTGFLTLLAANTVDDEFAADVRAARDAVVLPDPAWPAD
jgi:prevent-host-death family protein